MSSAWLVPKEALEASLTLLFEVPARHGVDSSEYVKIEKYKDSIARLSLASEMGGCVLLSAEEGCPFKEPVYIDRRMLDPFVTVGKDLSPEHYEVKSKDGQIVLRHGTREGKYTSNKKASGYSKPPSLDVKPQVISDDFGSLLLCAKGVAVDDPVAPHLSCVYVYPDKETLKVLAASGHIFFLGEMPLEKNFRLKNAALPLPLIKAAKAENNAALLYSDKVAVLKFSCGTLWHTVKSEARKKFPRQLIEDSVKKGLAGETLLTMNAEQLSDSANRADKYMKAVSADDPPLKIETKKGDQEIRIRCNAAGVDFCEQIQLPKPSKGDIDIEWPLSDVLPILEYCKKSGVARISKDEKGRTCFSSKGIALLIGRREKQQTSSKKKNKSKEKEEE